MVKLKNLYLAITQDGVYSAGSNPYLNYPGASSYGQDKTAASGYYNSASSWRPGPGAKMEAGAANMTWPAAASQLQEYS